MLFENLKSIKELTVIGKVEMKPNKKPFKNPSFNPNSAIVLIISYL